MKHENYPEPIYPKTYITTAKQTFNNLYGKDSNRWFTSLYKVEPEVQRYIDTDIAQIQAMQKKVDEIGQGLRKYDFKPNSDILESIPNYIQQLMLYNMIDKKEKHMNVMNGIPVRDFTIANFRDAMPSIKNVIFNDPATIIQWSDGSKTVVKAENEAYDPEKGFTMAYVKKMLGNKGNYYNVLRKWLPKRRNEPKEETVEISLETLNNLSKKANDIVDKTNDTQAKAYKAYDILRNVYCNASKPLKADYESAIKEALGYLEEVCAD